MTSPKPLTREELDAIEMVAYSDHATPDDLDRMFAQSRRCLELEELLAHIDMLMLQGHYTSAAIEVREAVKDAFDKSR